MKTQFVTLLTCKYIAFQYYGQIWASTPIMCKTNAKEKKSSVLGINRIKNFSIKSLQQAIGGLSHIIHYQQFADVVKVRFSSSRKANNGNTGWVNLHIDTGALQELYLSHFPVCCIHLHETIIPNIEFCYETTTFFFKGLISA